MSQYWVEDGDYDEMYLKGLYTARNSLYDVDTYWNTYLSLGIL